MYVFWIDPVTQAEVRRPFTGDASEIASLAEILLASYIENRPDTFPGIALYFSEDDPVSLQIGVTPGAWMLMTMDEDADARRTVGVSGAGGDSHYSIRWDQDDDVPSDWFVTRDHAMKGVEQWLADRTHSAELRWSDDCS